MFTATPAVIHARKFPLVWNVLKPWLISKGISPVSLIKHSPQIFMRDQDRFIFKMFCSHREYYTFVMSHRFNSLALFKHDGRGQKKCIGTGLAECINALQPVIEKMLTNKKAIF